MSKDKGSKNTKKEASKTPKASKSDYQSGKDSKSADLTPVKKTKGS